MDWKERIALDPAIRSGKPCVRGTRITFYDALEYLAGGMRACSSFAADRERRLATSAA
jgi:uncharacterized protein (DUF433 family)